MQKKNIIAGLSLLTLLFGINGCSTPCNTLPASQNPVITGGYTKLISFNYLIDTNITNTDSRVQTLELVAGQNPSAKIIIRYSDKAGQIFAQKLTKMFAANGYKSVIIGYKSNIPYTVDTYISFKPLDKSVVNITSAKSNESMVSVLSNLESGANINDSIVIKDTM